MYPELVHPVSRHHKMLQEKFTLKLNSNGWVGLLDCYLYMLLN
jgi:hypothetical protein